MPNFWRKVFFHKNDKLLRKCLNDQIFTDRVRSTRRELIVSLCLSVHTCRGGGTPARSSQPRGGTLTRSSHLGGGYPMGGYPTLGTPHQTRPGVPQLGWGYPPWVPLLSDLAGGTPPQVPPIRPGWGGYPTLGTPCQTWPGVPPLSDLAGGTPTGGTPPRISDGVLDTPQSVCLLRSRRRTFLYIWNNTSIPIIQRILSFWYKMCGNVENFKLNWKMSPWPWALTKRISS